MTKRYLRQISVKFLQQLNDCSENDLVLKLVDDFLAGRYGSSSFVWASSFIHCLAELDFGAGIEQPFGCIIVQNHQAVQRSIDWALEDDMLDGLFFCATLTGRRGGHTPFVQAGAETSDAGAEAINPDQALLGKVIPVVCVPVSGMVCVPVLESFQWGGLTFYKLTKTPLGSCVSCFNFGRLGALLGRAKPTKAQPRGDGTEQTVDKSWISCRSYYFFLQAFMNECSSC